MAFLNFVYKNSGDTIADIFCSTSEGASYEIKSASFTQSAATVAAHGTNYRTLTLQDGDGNTIGTITTNSGDPDGTALTRYARTPFIMSSPQNAILAANEQVKVVGSHGGSGASADGVVTLELVPARAY